MRSTGWLRLISTVVRGIPIKQATATLIFALLLTTALVWTRGQGPIWAPGGKCQQVVIASSQEKFGMLDELSRKYNNDGHTVRSGLNPVCVKVVVNQVNSGDAEAALENNWTDADSERPDVWAPASSAWVQLLQARAPGQAGLIPDGYFFKRPFSSPLVIAMPEQMAVAMGYPAPTGWTDILKLATSPAGWSSKGHPEWGPFRLGRTNPHSSTSGLHALIAMYSAIGADINVEAVDKPEARAVAAGIERRVAHFRQTASAFLEALHEVDNQSSNDPTHLKVLQYMSALPVEEKQLVDYNDGIIGDHKVGEPNVRLLPIYPEDSPTADHPYVILNWPGTSAIRVEAAADFYNFLTAGAQQDIADQKGFRLANGQAGSKLRQHTEVNPLAPSPLSLRDGAVLAAELRAWDGLRKPLRVMILINRAADVKARGDAVIHLQDALKGYQAQDQVMIATYPNPDSTDPFLEIQPMTHTDSSHLDQLRRAVEVPKLGVKSNVPSPLVVPLGGALNWMGSSFVPTAINAILLVEMSPGSEQPGDTKLRNQCSGQPPSHFVQVFPVGPPNSVRLTDLALACNGAPYQPNELNHFLIDAIPNF
jgi:Ca-activated chloride channel homolog